MRGYRHSDFLQRYGPRALITGGSYGLGGAFARDLARRGFALTLAARDAEKLNALAAELGEEFGTSVQCVALDLSEAGAAAQLAAALPPDELGLVVHNVAGIPYGDFGDAIEAELRAVQLNCALPLELSLQLLPSLRRRHRSGLIFVSSLQAIQGVPLMANYAATKAYDLILAEGLHYELRAAGVDVLGVPAGLLNKQRGDRRGPGATYVGDAARSSLDALGRRAIHVPGFLNNLYFHASRWIPRRSRALFLGRIVRTLILKQRGTAS